MNKEQSIKMKSRSTVQRLFTVLLIVLLPLIIFCIAIYTYSSAQSRIYYESAQENSFKDACNQVSIMFSDLNALCNTVAESSELLSINERGRYVPSDYEVTAALSRISDNTAIASETVFYVQGRADINTKNGRLHYDEFEADFRSRYHCDLSESFLFSRMNSVTSFRIFLLGKDDDQDSRVLAVLNPFYPFNQNRIHGDFVCFIKASDIGEKFSGYIHSKSAEIIIYNTSNNIVYSRNMTTDRPSLRDVYPYSGTGLFHENFTNHETGQKQRLTVMRYIDEHTGLTIVVTDNDDAFYSELKERNTGLLVLIGVLIFLFVVSIMIVIYVGYIPVRRLASRITGSQVDMRKNELELIESSYNERISENEMLSFRLSRQKEYLRHYFLLSFAAGRTLSQSELRYNALCADIDISPAKRAAFMLMLPEDSTEELTDSLAQLPRLKGRLIMTEADPESHFGEGSNKQSGRGCRVLLGMYAIGNTQDEEQDVLETANLIRTECCARGAEDAVIGISRLFDTISGLHQAFLEAEATILVGASEDGYICHSFGSEDHVYAVNDNCRLPQMPKTLLTESIRHGDDASAQEYLNTLLEGMKQDAQSLLMQKVLCGELAEAILASASQAGVTVGAERIRDMVMFTDYDVFCRSTRATVNEICQSISHTLREESLQEKAGIISFIREHCFEQSFSLSYLCDETHTSKTKINYILKESMDCSFSQYVSDLRMEEFKRQLIQTDLPVQEIVTNIGYVDVSSSLRKFKALTGMTALQYRNTFTNNDK